jgi:hypothetical protein
VAFSLLTVKTYSQSGAVILLMGQNHPHVDYKMHSGIIILNSGDTIKGNFKYADMEFPSFNLKYYENGSKMKRYMLSKIKEAVLEGSDTSLTKNNSTIFVKLFEKDNFLYRQLTFGDIKIYDEVFLVNENKGVVTKKLVVSYQGKKYKTESDKELLSLINKLHPDLFKPSRENISRQEIIRRLNKQS